MCSAFLANDFSDEFDGLRLTADRVIKRPTASTFRVVAIANCVMSSFSSFFLSLKSRESKRLFKNERSVSKVKAEVLKGVLQCVFTICTHTESPMQGNVYEESASESRAGLSAIFRTQWQLTTNAELLSPRQDTENDKNCQYTWNKAKKSG